MRITQKKIVQTLQFIENQIQEYKELEEAGYRNYSTNRYTLQDVKEYMIDLFDIEEKQDDTE